MLDPGTGRRSGDLISRSCDEGIARMGHPPLWMYTIEKQTARTPVGFALICLRATPLSYSFQRRMMRVALMPPKPKELDRATSKLWWMALLGT